MGYDHETAERQADGTMSLPARLRATWGGFPGPARWGAIALAALVAVWVLSGWLFGSEEVTYRTATATRGTIEQTVTALGSLQPKEYVNVGAQVSGQLKKVYVEVGDEVREGDLLAEIDAKVYETEVAAARARLTDLQSQLAGAQAELVLARRQYNRNADLAKIDAVSRDDLDTSETAVQTISAQIGSLKAQIEQQKSTVEGGEANLGYTKIYAPIDGTVTSQAALQGQTLNANQTAPTILTISDLDTMTVEAQVAEADVGKLETGMPVYFTTLGAPERRWTSTVRQVLPTPEIVNEVVLYTALVDIANPDGRLMKDMTAQVFFLLGEAQDVVIVPVNAISEGPHGNAQVSVLTDKGPRLRDVKVGLTNRVSAEISEGLDEGETVVTGVASSEGASSGRRRVGFF
ncbi:efflux RND transporter periplasmic adaptor subunit [Parvibaculum sp.]|uniref:efflux RND transporter periplasmic adaptor subunit n=2 Tax=Parvibaculum sp. TaxID=2024848 RepID=UPI001B1BF7B0|nr:efflux RND transporter periplasmic adaptor subunit [Parvibaculum sp.]MBO6678791.1 efflux RND transporter periplasmic adaptor subunit [Parvibaculum sp.]MBO6684857.1 efflux RND transporter periplasmic adaptor subunit [Parvibaculum sp.]MBO6903937.1 efflux RND transporter periplasmic adaptor subunit [Parvibaculum sp.]